MYFLAGEQLRVVLSALHSQLNTACYNSSACIEATQGHTINPRAAKNFCGHSCRPKSRAHANSQSPGKRVSLSRTAQRHVQLPKSPVVLLSLPAQAQARQTQSMVHVNIPILFSFPFPNMITSINHPDIFDLMHSAHT